MPQFWTPDPVGNAKALSQSGATRQTSAPQRDADALRHAINWCIERAVPYYGFVLTLPQCGDAILAFLGEDGQPCGAPELTIDPNGVAVLRLLQLTLHEALVVCLLIR